MFLASMNSDECLRICLTLGPSATISSSLYARGKLIANKTFREPDCAQPWVKILQDIAGATKISDGLDTPSQSRRPLSPIATISPSSSTPFGLEPSEPDLTYFDNLSPSRRREGHWPPHAASEGSRHSIIDTPLSTTLPTGNGTNYENVLSHVNSSTFAPASWSAHGPLSTNETVGPRTEDRVGRGSASHTTIQAHDSHAQNITTRSSTPACEARVDAEVDGLGSGLNALAGNMDISIQGSPMPSSPTWSEEAEKQRLPSCKRMKKLKLILDNIRDYVVPAQQDHNEKVDKLYSNYVCSPGPVPTSMEQFGQLLGRLGNLSNTLGVVYSLLSWEIFRREEERLVQEERQPANIAAKRVRESMTRLYSCC